MRNQLTRADHWIGTRAIGIKNNRRIRRSGILNRETLSKNTAPLEKDVISRRQSYRVESREGLPWRSKGAVIGIVTSNTVNIVRIQSRRRWGTVIKVLVGFAECRGAGCIRVGLDRLTPIDLNREAVRCTGISDRAT